MQYNYIYSKYTKITYQYATSVNLLKKKAGETPALKSIKLYLTT